MAETSIIEVSEKLSKQYASVWADDGTGLFFCWDDDDYFVDIYTVSGEIIGTYKTSNLAPMTAEIAQALSAQLFDLGIGQGEGI